MESDPAQPVDALILDLLEWIASQPRPYSEVMSAWRTSCPRLPVWEDANDRGFVEREPQKSGDALVRLTPRGREFLESHRASPRIAIERVGPESDAILANLFQLYLHDLAESFGFDVGDDGRYAYDTAPHWENGDPVYLARVGGALAGFAIVSSAERWIGDPGVRDVREFFVVRRHRRSGVGRVLARRIWSDHPGRWLVRVLEANRSALAFWRVAVRDHTGGRYVERSIVPDGRTRIFLTFDDARG
jgi:predicted acetyltransferase